AQHGDGTIVRNMKLLENFVSSGQRLREHRQLIGNRIGNREQILIGQPDELGEGPVAPENSHHGAIEAMAPDAGDTKRASATCRVDLTDDALAPQPRISRVCDAADELVAWNASVSHVPARYFQVGTAD